MSSPKLISQELLDEVEVLVSIFGSSQIQFNGENEITYRDYERQVVLQFSLPRGYPNCRLTVGITSTYFLINNKAEEAANNISMENIGETVIFKLIEEVKDQFDKHSFESSTTSDDLIDSKVETPRNNVWQTKLKIVHGPITTELKSSFQSHAAAVSSLDDVMLFREIVLDDKRVILRKYWFNAMSDFCFQVARATHNIFAYRFICPTTGAIYQDYDDDGETAAGYRLAEMIRLMDINSVAIIVSRWFGGTLLGADRFKLICNSARSLLVRDGFVTSSTKKQKKRGTCIPSKS